MTREEAFKKMINIRAVHHKLNCTSSYVRGLRKKINDGHHVTEDVMKELLTKYGAKLAQEEKWEL